VLPSALQLMSPSAPDLSAPQPLSSSASQPLSPSAAQPFSLRINTDPDETPRPSPDKPYTAAPLGKFNRTVSVYTTPEGKQYLVDVQLGYKSNVSTRQVARLVIDTGSGDTVVFGEVHCDNRDNEFFNHELAGRECFVYQNSSSFKFNVQGLGRRVNSACTIEAEGHPGAYCREALLIDGYKAEVGCELAWEDAQFADLDGMPDQEMIRTDICVVNDTTSEGFKMRYWNNTQGTLGMFYHICAPGQGEAKCETPYPALLSTLPRSVGHTFTFDFNPPGIPSYMHFGVPEEGWKGMQWSETQPIPLVGRTTAYSAPYAFHSFEIYDMSLCGANLLSNYSSHWTAMVDTGASCLSLPEEFFQMVTAWVPALECVSERVQGYDNTECKDSLCSEFNNLTICYLAEGASADDLPVLSFRLSEKGSELHLPLSGLIVNDRPSGRPRVCVNPADSIAMFRREEIKSFLFFPKISFGTLALRNLHITFDMEATTVGLRNKVTYDVSTNAGLCAEPVSCIGAQSPYPAKNLCIDPPCEQVYFHVLDESRKTCRISNGFLVSVIITLVAFALAEIALSEIYDKLAHKLTSNYTATG